MVCYNVFVEEILHIIKMEHLTLACLSAYHIFVFVHYLIRDGAIFINSYTITSKKNIIIVSINIIVSFLLIKTTSFIESGKHLNY